MRGKGDKAYMATDMTFDWWGERHNDEPEQSPEEMVGLFNLHAAAARGMRPE